MTTSLPPERDPDDPRLTPVYLRKHLLAEIDDRTLRGLVRNGVYHRLRHGAYCSGEDWGKLDRVGRAGVVSRAVLQQAKTDVVLSHTSCLGEYDAALWDIDLSTTHITRLDHKAGRNEAGVQQHIGHVPATHRREINGITVMSPARAALETVTLVDIEHALVVVNDLLHRGLMSDEEYAEMAAYASQWPHSRRADLVGRLADKRCSSPGESRFLYLCHRYGLPRPELQYPVRDAGGRVIAYLDFAWPERGVFAEFDGRVKYTSLLEPGQSATDVVLKEKRREELVCRITGWRCLRFIWADLATPYAVVRLVRETFADVAAAA